MTGHPELPADDRPPQRQRPPWCTGPADDRHLLGLDQITASDTVFAFAYHDDGCLSFRVRADAAQSTLSDLLGALAHRVAVLGDFPLAEGNLTMPPPPRTGDQ